MKEKRIVNTITMVLLILGALNWGAVALFNFDFIMYCCGCESAVARVIYFIFGAAAVYAFFVMMKVRERKTRR